MFVGINIKRFFFICAMMFACSAQGAALPFQDHHDEDDIALAGDFVPRAIIATPCCLFVAACLFTTHAINFSASRHHSLIKRFSSNDRTQRPFEGMTCLYAGNCQWLRYRKFDLMPVDVAVEHKSKKKENKKNV